MNEGTLGPAPGGGALPAAGSKDERIPFPRCGARKRGGKPCRHPAGYGTDHPGEGPCIYHGGAKYKHGAYSVTTADPGTQALADRLAEVLNGEPQALLRPADRQALESASVLIRQREKLETWLNEHGPIDEHGKPKGALEALIKVERALLEHLRELGMTPAARARLGLDVARSFSLADELAQLHNDEHE